MIYWWIHDLRISSNVKSTAITDNNLLSTGGVGLEPAVLRVQTEIQETEYVAMYINFALLHLRAARRTFHLFISYDSLSSHYITIRSEYGFIQRNLAYQKK